MVVLEVQHQQLLLAFSVLLECCKFLGGSLARQLREADGRIGQAAKKDAADVPSPKIGIFEQQTEKPGYPSEETKEDFVLERIVEVRYELARRFLHVLSGGTCVVVQDCLQTLGLLARYCGRSRSSVDRGADGQTVIVPPEVLGPLLVGEIGAHGRVGHGDVHELPSE